MKQPINRIVVIAGPKASGKSFLIDALRQGGLSELAAAACFDRDREWQYAAALDFEDGGQELKKSNQTIEQLLFHYETTRPWYFKHQYGFAQDPPLCLLQLAKEITFITVWAPRDLLMSRFLERNPRFENPVEWLRQMYYHPFFRGLDSDFRKVYRDASYVPSMYANWLRFCSFFAEANHIIVDSRDENFSFHIASDQLEEWISQLGNGDVPSLFDDSSDSSPGGSPRRTSVTTQTPASTEQE